MRISYRAELALILACSSLAAFAAGGYLVYRGIHNDTLKHYSRYYSESVEAFTSEIDPSEHHRIALLEQDDRKNDPIFKEYSLKMQNLGRTGGFGFMHSAIDTGTSLNYILTYPTDKEDYMDVSARLLLDAMGGQSASEYVASTGYYYYYTPIFSEDGLKVTGAIGGGYDFGPLLKSHQATFAKTYRIFFLLSIPFFLLLAYAVAEWVTEPISSLTLAAKKISDGDYTQTIKVNRKDEFGKLANTLMDMQTKLSSFQQEMEMKIKDRTDSLRAILRVAVSAREKNRLAQELHDSLGQFFASLNIKIEHCLRIYESNPEKLPERLKEMRDITGQGTDLTRHIIANLHAGASEDREIRSVLNQFLKNFTEGTGITYNLSADIRHPLEISYRTTIYHIVTEAVINIGKHSGADYFSIDILITEKAALLKISDNGSGFNLKEDIFNNLKKERKYGILSMKKRVEDLGGDFLLESSPGEGTSIKINFDFGLENGKTKN